MTEMDGARRKGILHRHVVSMMEEEEDDRLMEEGSKEYICRPLQLWHKLMSSTSADRSWSLLRHREESLEAV